MYIFLEAILQKRVWRDGNWTLQGTAGNWRNFEKSIRVTSYNGWFGAIGAMFS